MFKQMKFYNKSIEVPKSITLTRNSIVDISILDRNFTNAILIKSIKNADCVINFSLTNFKNIINNISNVKFVKFFSEYEDEYDKDAQIIDVRLEKEYCIHAINNINKYISKNILALSNLDSKCSSSVTNDEKFMNRFFNNLELCFDDSLVINVDIQFILINGIRNIISVLEKSKNSRLFINFDKKYFENSEVGQELILENRFFDNSKIFILNDEKHSITEINNIMNLESMTSSMQKFKLLVQPSDKSVKICTFLHSSSISGAERSHIEVVDELVNKGMLVHTICPFPDSGIKDELIKVGSSVTFLPRYNWWMRGGVDSFDFNDIDGIINLDVIHEIEKGNFDLVLTQTSVVPQAAFAAKLLNIPHIWWIREFGILDHDLMPPNNKTEFSKLIRYLSHIVLTNSIAVKDWYFPRVNDDNIRVIYPTPSINGTQNVNKQHSVLKIAVVGSLSAGKGHIEVIKALKIVKESQMQFKFFIFGEGSEEQRSRLLNEINECELLEYVEFKENVKDRNLIYSEIDIVIISSRMEAFGRIAFEAASSFVPIIYSNSGGIKEYMINNITGLSYENGNIEDLADKILVLLNDKDKREFLKITAKKELEDFILRNDSNNKLYKLILESINEYSNNSNEKIFNKCVLSIIEKNEIDIKSLNDSLREIEKILESKGLSCKNIELEKIDLINKLNKNNDRIHNLATAMINREDELKYLHKLTNDLMEKNIDLYQIKLKYQKIVNSNIWKGTLPIRKLLDFVKSK